MQRLLIISMILILFAVLLSGQITSDFEDYYQILREKAVENLGTLPIEKGNEFLELLDEFPDVIMAFFLAYEESSKLLLANSQDLVSHHYRVKHLWKEYKDKYSLPFFLSYIAKITVTDERITPYRDLFEEYGLYELKQQYPNNRDLVIELNLWTRRFMTFKPTSGRDMAPYDILKRSNIGRCEEMQIFFISSARTVGIPARPAMTPLWAHTDNNHAWVEVFVDGKWSYLGAVEPAYETDYAWFSASAAKAIMIMASAAFPAENDIVLREDRYYSLINSTPNYDSDYIKSRKVSLKTIDTTGEIIPQAQIAVMVYNWGMLRSIHTTETDDNGDLELVIGIGSVFISAAKDTLFALCEIPAQQEDYQTEIVLNDNHDVSVKAALHYPDPKLPPREQREEWSEYLKAFEEYYNSIVAEYQDSVFPYEQADSLLQDVWTSCRNNKDNFLLFYKENSPIPSHFLVLLTKIDEKFLWQADHDQLQKLYNAYMDMKHLDYSDEIMVNLFSPTVMFEELPKTEMKESLTKWREGDIQQRIFDLVNHINDNYVIDNDRAIQSLIPFDLAIDLTYLTSYQHKMLICSVLRANYIPASYARIPDIVNIFSNNQWRYYNLRDNSFHSSAREENNEEFTKLNILTVDEHNYPIPINEEQYTVSFLHNGLFYPYEDQPEVNSEGKLIVMLKPGEYQLQIGYRINNDLTRIYINTIKTGTATEIEQLFILEDYPQKWERFSEELVELSEYLDSKRVIDNKPYYFVLGDYDREPVRRTADRLIRIVEDAEVVWLGAKIAPDTPNYYQFSEEYFSWLLEHPTMKERVLTLYYNNEEAAWSHFDGFWDTFPE